MDLITKEEIKEIISKLRKSISYYEYDYELSDTPGFRDPADKRYDQKCIAQCEAIIEDLELLLEIM